MADKLFSLFPIGQRHWKTLSSLIDFTKEVVKDRAENFQQKVADEKNRVAFLDLLLGYRMEDESSLTLDNIQEEVDTFMFEGHDTTTCSIAWTLFLIGNHPEVRAPALKFFVVFCSVINVLFKCIFTDCDKCNK